LVPIDICWCCTFLDALSEEAIQKLVWTVKEFKSEDVKVKNGTKFGAVIKPEDLQWEGIKVKYV